MSAVGVKKQYTKFQVLSTVIPKAVEDEVKSMLCKQEAEYPERNAYKLLKSEIFRILITYIFRIYILSYAIVELIHMLYVITGGDVTV